MNRIIFFIAVLIIFLVWNWWIIKRRSPNHGAQVVYRSAAWLFGSICFASTWTVGIAFFVGFHLAFWFPFDTILNLMNGEKWNYIGETAWLDKQARKWPGAFIPGKFLLFIMGIGFLIWPTGY